MSLTNVANKINSGDLEVAAKLKHRILRDLQCGDINSISHQLKALILLCDKWGDYMRLGITRSSHYEPLIGVVGM
jgi:hypothetical protein